MRLHNYLLPTALLLASIQFASAAEPNTELDPRVIQSRTVTKEFFNQLSGRLQQAIKEGGPVKAIKVCNVDAPTVAAAMSEKNKWDIGRTSLKIRNPNNEPDAWESKVLQRFEERKQQGEDITQLEHYEESELNGKKVFRYMKAIPTGGLCLTCHGVNIAVPVKTALKEHYPQDKATGFEVGDIRGAFTIVQYK